MIALISKEKLLIKTDITFNILEPEPNTYHVLFRNQRDLAHSMMRIQEYYEGASELVRGQHFTLEEFLHHFTDKDGTFTYTYIWAGFNVPGHVVEDWRELFSSRSGLTHKEQQMLDAIDSHRKNDGPWYLIASAGRSNSRTSRHELAHARYYLDPAYKSACDELTASMAPKDRRRMSKRLLEMGYCEAVIADEIQAYLSTDTPAANTNRFGEFDDLSLRAMKRLRKLFNDHRR